MPEITGIIIAGGRASRLGQSKPLLRIGGQIMLARIAAALDKVCSEIVLVVRSDQDDAIADTALALRMHVVVDNFNDVGPLGGIEAGLRATTTDLAFVTGADHPFVSHALISALCELSDGYDAVVPEIGELLQPLQALYRTSLADEITTALEADQRSPMNFLRTLIEVDRALIYAEASARALDAGLRTFVDIDTTDDLTRARAMLKKSEVIRPDIRGTGI
jgi:molybdopterin-guanine dinucleotide biosynthesis protein A